MRIYEIGLNTNIYTFTNKLKRRIALLKYLSLIFFNMRNLSHSVFFITLKQGFKYLSCVLYPGLVVTEHFRTFICSKIFRARILDSFPFSAQLNFLRNEILRLEYIYQDIQGTVDNTPII